jgi:hypothetical protein
MTKNGYLSPKTALSLELIKTLIYFRARKLPAPLVVLTRFSLFKSLETEKITGQVAIVLEELKDRGLVSCFRGFYYWGKKEKKGKTQDLKIAAEKMKMATGAAFFLRHLPFLRLVAVSGTVASGNPRSKSDIDLFLVVRKGRIWMARLGVLLVLELIGKRKKGQKKKDRFCLNCLLAEDSLKMKFFDLYSAQELLFLTPLLAQSGIIRRLRKKNVWIKKYLGDFDFDQEPLSGWWQERAGGFSWLSWVLEQLLLLPIFDWLERWLGKKQAERIERKRKQEKDGQVYWGDDALIFHPKPKSVILKKIYERILIKDREKIKNFALSFNR